MSKGERCRECQQWIAASDMKCSCGFIPARVNECVQADHNCCYQLQGQRCKLPGSISHSTHANGTWYCSGHYRSLGNPKEGEEWFHYVEQHFDEIIDQLTDWRRKLHQDNQSIIIRRKTNE